MPSESFLVLCHAAVTAVPTLYFRSSSNLSSNLWIFFFSMWILFVSWADVSSSFSSSQDPRDELRLRLERLTTIQLTFPRRHPSHSRHMHKPRRVFLPDKRVRVRRRGRDFGVVQVLLALSVGVEAGGQHRVAVLLHQLADQTSPGVGGQPGLLPVHALPLQRVRWDWF